MRRLAARGQPITIGCFVRYRAEGRLLSYALAGNTGVVHWRDPSMPDTRDPRQNHLLAALSPAERERIYPHLRLVPMPLGEVLYESGDVLRHVYFPVDSIVSLLYVLADGASAEISVVGNEGLIGIALLALSS